MVHLPSSGERSTLSMIRPCPTQNLPRREALIHRRPTHYAQSAVRLKPPKYFRLGEYSAYLLLELFMDRI